MKTFKKVISIFFYLPIIFTIKVFYSSKRLNRIISFIINQFFKTIRIYSRGDFFSQYFLLNNSYFHSTVPFRNLDLSKVAIVIQGPVLDLNFLLGSIKHYKSNFPKSTIIVSTWKGLDKDVLKKLELAGAKVILSSKPNYNGYLNINLQVVSSLNGINYAKKLKCQFVLKTRTDNRLFSNSLLYDLLNLYELYCLNNNTSRIIINTQIRTAYFPFFPSDFFIFGHIENLTKLFSVPLQKISFDYNNKKNIYNSKNSVEYLVRNNMIPEVYLFFNYAKKCFNNPKLKYSVKNYWIFLSEYTILVDFQSLFFYWNKGEYREDLGKYLYSTKTILGFNKFNHDFFFDHNKWLSLKMGKIKYNPIFEKRIPKYDI